MYSKFRAERMKTFQRSQLLFINAIFSWQIGMVKFIDLFRISQMHKSVAEAMLNCNTSEAETCRSLHITYIQVSSSSRSKWQTHLPVL